MRKQVIAGNWKMNKTWHEATDFMEEITRNVKTSAHTEAIICAPFIYLPEMVRRTEGSEVMVAAQNMHYEATGAYTGEISPAMLESIGVTHVVLGHSERRAYYNETDETVNKKVKAAFKYHLTPIVCVGESLEQREADETFTHIEKQVKSALDGLTKDELKQTIIAYEPIWAIGTGKTATSDQANEVCGHIRSVIKEVSDAEVADKLTIQYGGSVNLDNIEELLQTEHIDGALVGGASLEAESFTKLVQAGVANDA